MLGFFSWETRVTRSFGVATAATSGGLATDIDVLVQSVVSGGGGVSAKVSYARASAFISSRLEGTHWGMLLGKGQAADVAISASHALTEAMQEGQKIYVVDSSNDSALLASLNNYDPVVQQDVSNALASGKRVSISERNVGIGTWTGIGYIVEDPATGAGAYKIAGGQNGGGFNCQCFSLDPNLEFLLGAILLASAKSLPVFVAVASILLTAFAIYESFCKIDSAKCLTQSDRDLLKDVVVGLLAISLIGGLFGGILGAAAALIICSIVILLWIDGVITWMQRMNALDCRP